MLHLHNCIYFADLGILKENRKEDAVQFLSFTSQKAMSPCAEEKKNTNKNHVKSENTDFFKTFNHLHSPDLI